VVDPEAEGLPGYADDDSFADPERASNRIADGPEPAALPADRPVAVDDFGTTANEQRDGEPLEDRLRREEPDVTVAQRSSPAIDPVDEAQAEWESDRGDELDRLETDRDAGRDAPSARGVLDPVEPADSFEELDEDPPQAEDSATAAAFEGLTPGIDSPVSLYDRDDDGEVGRLVAPDEGAHGDDEKDEVAADRGVSGGGASAEELAIHEVPELP
jgi:hypothetical protein